MPKSHSEPRTTQVTPEPALEKRTRRQFTPEYKLRILAEADACQHGELGAIVRREMLYSNQLSDPIPAEYLVMVEWKSLRYAQGNMPHVNVKPNLLHIHGQKVLNNCLHMPNVRMSDSMFREQTNREVLNGIKS